MSKKNALFLLKLLIVLVLTAGYSPAQSINASKTSAMVANQSSISQTSDLSARRWNLIEINGQKVKNATPPFIEFNATDGRFTGKAGCNTMFGKFENSGGRNAIKLSGIGTTRMFCSAEGVMKLEGDFIKALQQATRFEQQGNTLNLFARNKLILKFSSTPGSSNNGRVPGNGKTSGVKLEDRKWNLTAIAGKQLPKVENRPFIVFNKREASAGGDSGCNSYGGSYKTEGDKISITEIIQTMRACVENERMNIERELFDGLRQADRFEIKSGKLNLYQGSKLLLTFDGAAKE